MLNPPLDGMVRMVDSKYTLVVAVARRARSLIEGQAARVETNSSKPVTIALEEIAERRFGYERTHAGIK